MINFEEEVRSRDMGNDNPTGGKIKRHRLAIPDLIFHAFVFFLCLDGQRRDGASF